MQSLDEQKREFQKALEQKELQKKMRKSEEKSIKSYSFNSVISKPPFVSQIKKEYLTEEK